MKKGMARCTAFCMAAGLTLSMSGFEAMAAGTELSLVGLGSTTKATKTETTEAAGESAEVKEEAAKEEAAEEKALDTSMIDTRGIAQCEEYINIRAAADREEGEILGKLYNNSAVQIEDVTADGWYKVKSGNVEGYVAAEYIAVGSEAEALAEEVGYKVAEVGAEVLNVRASTDTDSDIVATVTNAQQIEVVEDCGEWLKVAVDTDCYGYVSADYVNAETYFRQAESLEEEQERLDAEYEQYLAEQAAAEAAYEEYLAYQEAAYTEASYDDYSYDYNYYDEAAAQQAAWDAEYLAQEAAQQAQAEADAAMQQGYDAQTQAQIDYQAYLDAQAAADAACASGDEQLVYETAAAAQAAYEKYLASQAAADAQMAAGTQAQQQAEVAWTEAEAAADAAESVVESYDTYVEDTEVDAYVDDSISTGDYVDDSGYEETYVDDSSSSGGGQSIVDFACQFVGNPYVWGGTSLTNGADCSGFTQSVMANFGISIPRTAAEQYGSGTPVSLSDIQPGDLLFYGDGISHVSIYMGGGQVVHASNSNTGIIISDYGYRSPVGARRYW